MNRGKQHPAHFKLQSYLQKIMKALKGTTVLLQHTYEKN